ncbi:hypothetical protein AYO20_08754 [Fonsecaea nubica]|uniref:Heterokaryon incompatibility domain-containing protein n=1 Tax=Fonsecaea nubica TaxID=856822 RepID=A0A178CLQ3_9EURO|nr:hypothetical protein AYO20_08754 [Fonsecaea nubica]OAL30276.1 hypothetical protein AYO20_08754 [Fonsecaea nubica]
MVFKPFKLLTHHGSRPSTSPGLAVQLENDYPYRPLQPRSKQIRLFKLLPSQTIVQEDSDSGTEQLSPKIRGNIVHACLDQQCPEFEALSYEWGPQTPSSTILIDDTPFEIGPNLAAALATLQQSENERLLWIDAVCINQRDSSERGHQVAIMRDIYATCDHVLTWLGPLSSTDLEATLFFDEAAQQPDLVEWMKRTIGLETRKPTWEAIQGLLNKSYWERIWIVQELVCASSIQVLCGHCSLQWQILLAADSFWLNQKLYKPDLSDWLVREAQPETPWYEDLKAFLLPILTLTAVWAPAVIRSQAVPALQFSKKSAGPTYIETSRLARSLRQGQKSLFELMCLHSTSEATDPRDKIWALVGIAADAQIDSLTVDYALSVCKTEMSFVEFMLQTVKSLDFLCFPLRCLPRLSRDAARANDTFFMQMGMGLRPGAHAVKFAAAGNTWPEVRTCSLPEALGVGYSHLKIQGVAVDEIAALLEDLTDLATVDTFPLLRRIPILNRSNIIALAVSSIVAIVRGTVLVLGAAIYIAMFSCLAWVCCGIFAPEWAERWDSTPHDVKHWTSFKSLRFTPTDASFRPPPRESSDWLGERHLIELSVKIQQFLDFALRSSTSSPEVPARNVTREERVSSLYRTLVGNRTLDGTLLPPEWRRMFDVLVYGPAHMPEGFDVDFQERHADQSITGPAEPPAALTRGGASAGEVRSRAYVQPLLEAIRHTLSTAKPFITRKGLLGLTNRGRRGDTVAVLLGCSFLCVLGKPKLKPRKLRKRNHRRHRRPRDYEMYPPPMRAWRENGVVLRGTAYLDGYMEGQAIRELDRGDRTLTDFKLI